VGERARAIVAEIDAAWRERTAAVYARAAALGPVGALPDPGEAPEPVDRLVHLQNRATGQGVPAEIVEATLDLLELTARSEPVRALYGRLCGPSWRPELLRRAPAAFAAADSRPEALRELVGDFATLTLAGAVSGGLVVGMRPQDAEAAVPVLEEALAAHPELTVDLVIDHDPPGVRPAGALDLAA
jgi:hypothetical protein